MNEEWVTTAAAAERLGVSEDWVGVLARRGVLPAVRASGIWLVDAEALHQRVLFTDLVGHSPRGRPWSQLTVWAAMRWLDGDGSLMDALAPSVRSRLRRRLDAGDPGALLAAVRNRAEVVRVSVHRSRVEALREMVVTSGVAGAAVHGVGLTGAEPVDGYLLRSDLVAVQERVRARRSDDGAHRLRVVDDADALEGLTVAPRLAVAADLLDHAVDRRGSVDGRVVSSLRDLLSEVAGPQPVTSSLSSSSASS